MNLVFDAAKAGVRARGQARSSSAKSLHLAVAVGQGCDVGLARAVKAALRPDTASCRLYVAGMGAQSQAPAVHAMADAAVFLAGDDAGACADLYRAYRARRVPCYVLVNLDDAASERAQALIAREVREEDLVVCDEGSAAGVLGAWLLYALPDFELALGASLDCCRDAQVRRIVGQAVCSNAMIGALTFLKGADTPAMLACEVAMLFKLAGVYGAPLGKDRLGEVAGLTAFSVACKQVAGLALRLPLPSAVVKAVVAAAATYLAGNVVQERMRRAASSSPSSATRPPISQDTPQGA